MNRTWLEILAEDLVLCQCPEKQSDNTPSDIQGGEGHGHEPEQPISRVGELVPFGPIMEM